MKNVVAHGTFDIIHYGHINYLEKAKSYGNKLIVLVTSDDRAKIHGKRPYFNETIRMKMISSLKVVDNTVLRNTNITYELLKKLNCDVFVTTDEALAQSIEKNITTIVLPRTEDISSTQIKNHLKKEET